MCVNLDSAFHLLVPISVISTRFRPDQLESTQTWGLSVMEQWYSASSEMIYKSESLSEFLDDKMITSNWIKLRFAINV